MNELTQLPQWQALTQHYQAIANTHMRDLFQTDRNRFENFSLHAADLLLDYSKNRITQTTLLLFNELLEAVHLKTKINDMFSGKPINTTENRPALHIALRNKYNHAIHVNGQDIMPLIKDNLARMQALVEKIHNDTWLPNNKAITDIVNIGIGGSDLGPVMVTKALTPYRNPKLRFHFVSNIDSSHIIQRLNQLNPHSTLFIISSKSFTTQETLTNATTAKAWFMQQGGTDFNKHFVAVTGNTAKAQAFGFAVDNIFPVWEWIGGRYSLWSAIGLPIALAVGMTHFQQLLQGAYEMDQHFQQAPFLQNMPVILAILNIWYINFFGARVQAILPYEQYLAWLPAYLQQAEMESTGKHVNHHGHAVNYATGPVIFGAAGTNGQHAFYQLLHQGTQLIPSDFIVSVNPHHPMADHHSALFANALSQTKALLEGKNVDETLQELLANGYDEITAKKLLPHKILPGNQPSNTIVLPKLTPHSLGALIALYEHRIFVESVIWDINAFDQWGVELGKELANKILPDLKDSQNSPGYDSSTNGLINYYHQNTY